MQSEYFKKGSPENFNKILKRQKEGESDPKFAISDALQEYQQQLETSAGYQNQQQLNNAQIRQDIINFVIDYPISNLDAIKGMDFDEAKTLQQTTEKTIGEYEGLNAKNIISDEELIYIKETVGRTNEQLKKVLGLSTKLSLSFRDLKKELKPLKLARRVGLTNIPIIGKRIERAIESEEAAERTALGLKRQLRKKEAKSVIKSGTSTNVADMAPSQERKELAKEATSSLFTETPSTGISKEDRIEEERESDTQFETSSGLLEKILIAQQDTNEILLGKGNKLTGGNEFGILDYLGIKSLLKGPKGLIAKIGTATAAFGTLGLNATTAAGVLGGLTLAKILEYFFAPREDNPNEQAEVNRISRDLTSSANNEGVLQEDIDEENRRKSESIIKDEYDKYKSALGNMSFEEFRDARKNTGIGKYIEGNRWADPGNAESMKNIDKIKLYNEDPNKFSIMYPERSFFDKFKSSFFSGSSDELQNMYTGQSAAMGLTDISLSQKADKITELKTNNIEKLTTETGAANNVVIQKGGDTVSTTNTYDVQGSIGTSQEDGRFYHDIG